MKDHLSTTLRMILQDTAKETEWARSHESLKRVKQMIKDAPRVRSFRRALASGPSLIAEIKECSPSQGRMRRENIKQAPSAYRDSRIVKAVSVLTNRTHFGHDMKMERLERIRELTSKPILRKDFITDEYQVYQSRAYGADAILLMANILSRDELHKLSDLAFEIGLDVLFETHSASELDDLPLTAALVAINGRNFESAFTMAKILRQWFGAKKDISVDETRFSYASQLPANAIKVAASGVTVKNCSKVFEMGFLCALVGTSLLMDTRGVEAALGDFEEALLHVKIGSSLPHVEDERLSPSLA